MLILGCSMILELSWASGFEDLEGQGENVLHC